MTHYIFDIDGTLTPSRQPIVEEFKNFFLKFIDNNKVSLVTGSDVDKSIEQLGVEILDNVQFCFNCSGSDVYHLGQNIHTEEWKLPQNAIDWLTKKLNDSEFPFRTGLHLEHRIGMCNFSVVGRNANLDERFEYKFWDTEMKERIFIAEEFVKTFPDIEAKIGGETGIDIYPKGKDKSQILDYIEEIDLVFYGDKMEPHENDYPLAFAIDEKGYGKSILVNDYKDTWERLEKI